jgi:hypothetical protein
MLYFDVKTRLPRLKYFAYTVLMQLEIPKRRRERKKEKKELRKRRGARKYLDSNF